METGVPVSATSSQARHPQRTAPDGLPPGIAAGLAAVPAVQLRAVLPVALATGVGTPRGRLRPVAPRLPPAARPPRRVRPRGPRRVCEGTGQARRPDGA